MQINIKSDVLQPIPIKRKIIGLPQKNIEFNDPLNLIWKAASAPATLEQIETIKKISKGRQFCKNPFVLIDQPILENSKSIQELLDEIE
ncbi:unnamed protein product [Paramecium pentaurelia]|uniref:Uncharacterized protein n=1 Tax=Paramecium pentaurelia TaxID=43138 RepID=A0A8S1TD63_9CILI|nr:unnamed protein product [Paramecium pentaurelia]